MEKEENKKIVLPKELQREMLKFFLKTSIPRLVKQQRSEASIENDRSEKEDHDQKCEENNQ